MPLVFECRARNVSKLDSKTNGNIENDNCCRMRDGEVGLDMAKLIIELDLTLEERCHMQNKVEHDTKSFAFELSSMNKLEAGLDIGRMSYV